MHIRKLELHGFKSFPERTAFHFGDGISGVVGPNGCGKSNVVDAVKWCLGEQSPRSLRGKSMSDVIFGGSEGLAPMGLAEVTLTFVAADEPFPGEYERYEELQVTRRLFRDGGSEYLVNQQRVRLKDIHDLFLDSGAGNRLYSFIEQGRIGEIVNARPEERRTLIEEAAGITRFKVRRKEAEKRLSDTAENLDRVTDVLDNMTGRMRSLERQVGRAMRYRRLRSFIRQGEILIGLGQYGGLAADRRALGGRLRDAEAREADAHRKVERRESDLKVSRDALDVLERAVGESRDRLGELEASRREQESARLYQTREREGIEQRAAGLEKQRVGAEQARDEARSRAQRLAGELSEAEGALASIEGELDETRKEVRASESQVRERRRRIDQSRDALLDRDRALARDTAERDAAVQRRADLTGRGRRLAERSEQIDAEIAAATTAEALAKSDVAGASSSHAAAVSAATIANTRLAERVATRKTCISDARAAETAATSAARDLERVRARHESLAALAASHEGVEGGARDALSVPGVIGTLAEQLDVSADVETPLAAALGELLDAVLVPDAATAEAVRRATDGRVALISIDGAQAAANGFAGAIAGTLAGRAALGRVLGDCGIVDDLSSAIRLNAETGQAQVVRGQAAFVAADGSIRLGLPSGGGRLALERRRRLGELESDLEAKTLASETAASVASAASVQVQAAEAALDSARAAAEVGQAAVRDSRAAVAEKQRVLAACADQTRRLGAERLRLDSETNDTKMSMARTSERIAALEAVLGQSGRDRGQLERELEAEQAVLAGELRSLGQAREAVSSRASDAAGYRERLAGIRRSGGEIGKAETVASEQADRCAAELAAGRERLNVLVGEVSELEISLGALAEEQAALQARLDAERARVKASRDAQRELEDGLSALRDAKEEATRTRARIDRDAGKVREEIARIREQLQERYEVSVPGLLDRLERVGHIMLEVDSLARVDDLPVSAQPSEAEADMLVDLRVVPSMLDDGPRLSRWGERVVDAKKALAKLGEVNLVALREFVEVSAEHGEIDGRRADLASTVDTIRKSIARLNRESRQRFRDTFDRVDGYFQEIYPRLVGGGTARLELTDEEDLLETGVDISVQPPGKRLVNLTLLSGGETAMVAIALIFSLFRVKPSPFCLLDEVDAPLDEANGARFNNMLREMSRMSQFIVVTHNKKTMECVDTLYGVTMVRPGVSHRVSVQLD